VHRLEVENNYAGETPGTAGPDRRATFPERRQNGYRAFFEHMPFRRVRGEGFRLHRSIAIGRTVELFVLDERQHRDDQPCGDRLFVPCEEAAAPGRTLLGPGQLAWLKQGLAASPASWKLLANAVMAMALEATDGAPVNKDQWDGYAAERADLLGFVRERGIRDVAFLTGDIHTFFAGEVGVEGRGPDSVATEFVGGSISSLGLPEVAQRMGAPFTREQIELFTTNVQVANPHIKYDEQLSRGYGLLEAREDELLVEFRAVEARTRRSTDARTIGRFRVARGEPRVEVLEAAR
jgi:alkaline phosphatase D